MSAIPSGSLTAFHQPQVSEEEYSVYSAVIGDMFAGGRVTFNTRSTVKILVVKDHTVVDFSRPIGEMQDYLKRHFPSLSPEAFGDYVNRNKETHPLRDAFKIELKHVLIKRDEFVDFFKAGLDGWDLFYKKFPGSGGVVGFSRPGFNSAMSQAVVYFEHSCHGLCGTGYYLFIEKSGATWKVSKKLLVWQS